MSGPGDVYFKLIDTFQHVSFCYDILFRTSLFLIKTSGTVGMLLTSSVVNTETKKTFRMLQICSPFVGVISVSINNRSNTQERS